MVKRDYRLPLPSAAENLTIGVMQPTKMVFVS